LRSPKWRKFDAKDRPDGLRRLHANGIECDGARYTDSGTLHGRREEAVRRDSAGA
jgi:hypothetical protein